jgi:DNA-binding LytR/AlgR family response regulator
MNAAVCDDEPALLKNLTELVQTNAHYEVCEGFSSWKMLKASAEAGNRYDVVFMDIELGDKVSGLDCAEKLKKLLPNVMIVFVTAFADYSQEILMQPFKPDGFLLKPVEKERFDAVTALLSDKIRESGLRKLVISYRQRSIVLNTDEIRYLKSTAHQITVSLTGGRTEICYDKLQELSKRLPPSFSSCHKSYFVNMDYVSLIEGESVKLADGEVLPVSRSRYGDFRKRYFEYLGSRV